MNNQSRNDNKTEVFQNNESKLKNERNQMWLGKMLFSWIVLILISGNTFSQTKNVLMFISHEQAYYSEYIVMLKAFQANGYTVDVRSTSIDSAGVYFHYSNNLENAANELVPGSGFSQFENQFEESFGSTWNSDWNYVPPTSRVPVNGLIQNVESMLNYDALIIVGGTGALDYKYDGSYNSQGQGNRFIPATEIENSALKLNQLAINALLSGKPVLAQCHSARVPVYSRVPNTGGSGIETLGISLLKDNYATGFPEPQTADTLYAYGVNFRDNDRVTVSSPNNLLNDNGMGDYKIITTRDWYPQTIAYAARTLMNILETYPEKNKLERNISVLVLHGGALDVNNCLYINRNNDVPCNYGGGFDLPADYTDLMELLQLNSENDNYNFTVTQSDITDLNFPLNEEDITEYIHGYDVILFFKHWSTGVTAALQNSLLEFADNGGGIVGIHHGLYNDVDGELNKDIIANNLFGVESRENTWSANRYTYNLYSINHGHFVTTYGIDLGLSNQAAQTPSSWFSNPLRSYSNYSYSYYNNFSIYDEIYHNMSFTSGQQFGRSINEITPLLSNDNYNSQQAHTSGFVKQFNPSHDETIGRVAYFQPGERPESFVISNPYAQIIRNSIAWAANGKRLIDTSLPVELLSFSGNPTDHGIELVWKTASELNNAGFILMRREDAQQEYLTISNQKGYGTISTESEYRFVDKNVRKGRIYQYLLFSQSLNGDIEIQSQIAVGMNKPNETNIFQGYPSPFNPVTSIPYQISDPSNVKIEIINSSGQLVKILKNENHSPGQYTVMWDGTNNKEIVQSSGIYFVRLSSNNKSYIRKLILMK